MNSINNKNNKINQKILKMIIIRVQVQANPKAVVPQWIKGMKITKIKI